MLLLVGGVSGIPPGNSKGHHVESEGTGFAEQINSVLMFVPQSNTGK